MDVLAGHVGLPELFIASCSPEQGFNALRIKFQSLVARGACLLVERLAPVLALLRLGQRSCLQVALRRIQVAGGCSSVHSRFLIRGGVVHKLRTPQVLEGLLVPPHRVVVLLGFEHVVPLVLVVHCQPQPVLLLHHPVVLVEIHAQLSAARRFLLGSLLHLLLLFQLVLPHFLHELPRLRLQQRLQLLVLLRVLLVCGILHLRILEPQLELVESRLYDRRVQERTVSPGQPPPNLVNAGFQLIALHQPADLLVVDASDVGLLLAALGKLLVVHDRGNSIQVHSRERALACCPDRRTSPNAG
mmetsp:Transcript_43118/g.91575  ORF Transcript_43118/g.91575 Transcript_43118/m.91575 type:complete len:301 (-) Transcript_43118:1252-2154(-)